ncbi:MAG: hypothetical protein IJ125_02110 [Atopobiaceae bacterium]|nr:hypothetical protein [Atopobiaceae bacterium]
MQNRYSGDIGDFSKLGLLRVLHAAGLTIGLNWYLTPNETHNSDGLHVKYLDQEKFRACDEELWLNLKRIVDSGQREIRFLEAEDILQATFFSECLDLAGKTKSQRLTCRHRWFSKSLSSMSGIDLVCVDPDNGLVVPSALSRPKENKYVLPEELAAYYAQGSSVIYYQHKARRKDDFYIEQHRKLMSRHDFVGTTGLVLKFKTTSQRYYMFIVQPRHKDDDNLVEAVGNAVIARDYDVRQRKAVLADAIVLTDGRVVETRSAKRSYSGSIELSAITDWDFDLLAILIFDENGYIESDIEVEGAQGHRVSHGQGAELQL